LNIGIVKVKRNVKKDFKKIPHKSSNNNIYICFEVAVQHVKLFLVFVFPVENLITIP